MTAGDWQAAMTRPPQSVFEYSFMPRADRADRFLLKLGVS